MVLGSMVLVLNGFIGIAFTYTPLIVESHYEMVTGSRFLWSGNLAK